MSSSSTSDRPIRGLRKLKLNGSDSSSSSSDSDGSGGNARHKLRLHKRLSATARPGGASQGGPSRARAHDSRSSSLELSTSSSNASSTTLSALPAAFRQAAAASAATMAKPPVSREDDGEASGREAGQHTSTPSAGTQANAIVRAGNSEGDASTRVGGGVGGVGGVTTAASPSTGAPAPQGKAAPPSPAASSGPTLRTGAAFFFKQSAAPTKHSTSGSAAAAASPDVVREESGTRRGVAVGASLQVSADRAAPGVVVSAPASTEPSQGMLGASSAVHKPSALPSSTLPSSSAPAPPRVVSGVSSPSSSSSASITPSRVAATTAAAAAAAAPGVNAEPPAPRASTKLKVFSRQADSSDSDEERGTQSRPQLPRHTSSTAGVQEDLAPSQPVASPRLAAPSPSVSIASPAAAAARQTAPADAPRPSFLATQPPTNTTAATDTAAATPSSANGVEGLLYNRVSARGIGSVPASVIAAPSRPTRRALPRENTVTASLSTTVPGPQATHHDPNSVAAPRTAALPFHLPACLPEMTHDVVNKERSQDSARSTTTSSSGVAGSRPSRHAPRLPGPQHASPPTLSEGAEPGHTTARSAGTRAASIPSLQPQGSTASNAVPPPPLTLIEEDEEEKDGHRVASQDSAGPPPSRRSYAARVAAIAALQRQREAAVVIYDDRVPPQQRCGRLCGATGPSQASSFCDALVSARMVLGVASRDGAVPRAQHGASSHLHGNAAAGHGALLASRPVLHTSDRPRFTAPLGAAEWEATKEDADGVEDADVWQRGIASASTRSDAPEPRCAAARVKSHVSEAVLAQLLRQYAPPQAASGTEPSNGASVSSSFRSPQPVLSAGTVHRVQRQEGAAQSSPHAATRDAFGVPRPRRVSEVGAVDILNYRSTRGK